MATETAQPSSVPSQVDIVTDFLDAVAEGDLERISYLVSPGVDWSYVDKVDGDHHSATGLSQFRTFLRGDNLERNTTIVCAVPLRRFVIVSEHVRGTDGRAREREGAYEVRDNVITSAWITDHEAANRS